MSDINTFVFMHAGSTGVVETVNEVKITDLCLIAIKPNYLCNIQREPRIQNMVHVCFNPQATTEDSNLSQGFIDQLANETPFTEDALHLLDAFLKRLRGPVCFVAHNGEKFIYSLLRNYIKTYKYSFPTDYVCVDAIRGFQTGGGPKISLKNFYEGTTGKQAKVHVSAKQDVELLLKCACKKAGTFIAWANSSKTPFI